MAQLQSTILSGSIKLPTENTSSALNIFLDPSSQNLAYISDQGQWSMGGNMINTTTCLAGAGTQNAGLAIGGGTPSTTSATEEYTGTFTTFTKTFDYSSTTGKTMIVPPTSDPGVAGALWNNGGTLSISAG